MLRRIPEEFTVRSTKTYQAGLHKRIMQEALSMVLKSVNRFESFPGQWVILEPVTASSYLHVYLSSTNTWLENLQLMRKVAQRRPPNETQTLS